MTKYKHVEVPEIGDTLFQCAGCLYEHRPPPHPICQSQACFPGEGPGCIYIAPGEKAMQEYLAMRARVKLGVKIDG